MSLLDGLAEQLGVGGYDPVMEAEEEYELEMNPALEAALKEIDKLENAGSELSPEDIEAILNDDNPDNVAADIETGEENQDAIGSDAVPDEFKALEAMLDEMIGESEDPEGDPTDPDETVPEAMEGKDCEPGECGAPMECDDTDPTLESTLNMDRLFKMI